MYRPTKNVWPGWPPSSFAMQAVASREFPATLSSAVRPVSWSVGACCRCSDVRGLWPIACNLQAQGGLVDQVVRCKEEVRG